MEAETLILLDVLVVEQEELLRARVEETADAVFRLCMDAINVRMYAIQYKHTHLICLRPSAPVHQIT